MSRPYYDADDETLRLIGAGVVLAVAVAVVSVLALAMHWINKGWQ